MRSSSWIVRAVRLDEGDEAELAITDGCFAGRPGFVPGTPADLITYHDDPRDDPAILKRRAAIIRRGTRVR